MKKDRYHLAFLLASALLCATVAAAEPNVDTEVNWTNRLSLSLRFGLGISARFKGIGGSLQPSAPAANGRRTPDRDHYNYDDGYVLTDVSGNVGNQTWYWGYDNSSQVSGNNILFNRTTAPGLPADRTARSEPYIGAELTYNRQLGIKENWHNLRYGLEGAANCLPISLKLNSRFSGNLTRVTDAYPYTPGTTPPSAPSQGSFNGPGFVIGSAPVSSTTTFLPATVLEHDSFEANLWGFRLGPSLEFPFTDRLSVHLSGGLAVGLLDSSASWRQTITLTGEGPVTSAGHPDSLDVLWGAYVGLDAAWQLSNRWSIEGGVQFQDLGQHNQKLGIRQVQLDLSHSLFVLASVSYSF